MSKPAPKAPPAPRLAEPIDVVDGIPDRTTRGSCWRYLLLVAIGLVWLGVLVYCWWAGGVGD